MNMNITFCSRMRTRMKAFCALAASVALAFSLAGCASSQASSSATNSATDNDLEKVTFVLDYTPNTNHTGIYAARDLGYYEEVGIEIDIMQPPEDGADALVASGRAQFGISFEDVMANYLGSTDPLPVTAIAAIIQHNTSGIISQADANITRAGEMNGHSYATWDQAVEQAIVRTVVNGDGGDFSTIELVPAGTSDEVSGLQTGQFESSWCYEAWALQNALVQDVPVNYFSFRDMDERFDFYTPVIITNDELIENDPDLIARFLEATAKGYAYAAENPDEAAELLVAAVPEIDPDLALASQRYLSSRYTDDAPYWGYIDPARWNAFYTWMNDEQLTEIPLPLDTAFTNEFLPGAGQ